MNIVGVLNELQNITAEIEYLKNQIKELTGRKFELEAHVSDYLEQKGEDGLIYKGKMYSRGTRTRRESKKKEQRVKDMAEVLVQYGIDPDQSQEVVDKVISSMKGEAVETNVITVKPAIGLARRF